MTHFPLWLGDSRGWREGEARLGSSPLLVVSVGWSDISHNQVVLILWSKFASIRSPHLEDSGRNVEAMLWCAQKHHNINHGG